jgi:flagellar hook-associated protein 2
MTTTSATTSTSTTAITATDPASIGSALATALGGGTGVDMTQLATNVADAEYASQLANIDSQNRTLTMQISEASQLKNDLLALSTSLGTAVQSGSLSASPTVANSSVATASLPAGASSTASSYSLEVDNLASPQVLTSTTYASAIAATGSGTLTISPGTIASGSFTAGASPVTITIPSGATLTDVANAINGSGAGVMAYIAASSSGAQLVIKGAQGAANGFTISATETAGDPGLSALAWEPATGDPARLAESASDASYKLDGIARTSPSNTIDTAAPGLSLQLTGTNVGAPTTIGYSDPSSAISSAMQSFTTALNAIASELGTDMTASSGALGRDLAARNLRSQLSQFCGKVIMPNAAPGAPATLADLGLAMNKDGSFTLNSATLNGALHADSGAVAAMFTTGLNGVYGTLFTLANNLTSTGRPGSLDNAVSTYTTDQAKLATSRSDLVTRQDALRTRLVTQYAATNAVVAVEKSTLSYLQQQIAAWTNQTSSTSTSR